MYFVREKSLFRCHRGWKLHPLLFCVPVHRWKRDESGNKITHPVSGKCILQFVAIKRKDCGEWAIPGVSVAPPAGDAGVGHGEAPVPGD